MAFKLQSCCCGCEVTCLGAGCQGEGESDDFTTLHYVVHADSQVAVQNAKAIHSLSRTFSRTVLIVSRQVFSLFLMSSSLHLFMS